jgi:hypothetical protein
LIKVKGKLFLPVLILKTKITTDEIRNILKEALKMLFGYLTVLNIDNQETMLNIDNQGTILNIDNQGTILNIDNQGTILNIDNQGTMLNIDNQGTILNIDNQGTILNVQTVCNKLFKLLPYNHICLTDYVMEKHATM